MNDFFMNNFGIYARIQDHLLYLGRKSDNLVGIKATLNMYTGKNNEYYYKETQYVSEKMGCQLRSIHRQYDIYLSMENLIPINDYREYIMLRGGDLEYLRLTLVPKLEEIITKSDQIFVYQGDKLQVTSIVKPYLVTVSNDKKLCIAPEIDATNEESSSGIVALYMNNRESNRVVMSLNQVYSFMYFIRTFDLYGYAASMLAYLQRPPAQTNLTDYTTRHEQLMTEFPQIIDTSKRRFIGDPPKKHTKNYFESN